MKRTHSLTLKNAKEFARLFRHKGLRVTIRKVKSYGNQSYKYTIYTYRK